MNAKKEINLFTVIDKKKKCQNAKWTFGGSIINVGATFYFDAVLICDVIVAVKSFHPKKKFQYFQCCGETPSHFLSALASAIVCVVLRTRLGRLLTLTEQITSYQFLPLPHGLPRVGLRVHFVISKHRFLSCVWPWISIFLERLPAGEINMTDYMAS